MRKGLNKIVAVVAVNEKTRKTVVVGNALVEEDADGFLVIKMKITPASRHMVARNFHSLAGLHLSAIFAGGRHHE